MINRRLAQLFDQGRATAVLAGEAAPEDPTWSDRPDLLLAIRQLMLWAEERDRGQEAGSALRDVAQRSAEDAPFHLIDLLWSYTLVCGSGHKCLPVDHDELRVLARQALDAVAEPGGDDLTQGQATALRNTLAGPDWPSTRPS